MKREDVIRMAKEAGVIPVMRPHLHMEPIWWSVTIEDIERFAALVAASERERCAKVCANYIDPMWRNFPQYTTAMELADEIRGLNNET